jgi:HPt (histidine-containing phosphotransfer) domain-containing protein
LVQAENLYLEDLSLKTAPPVFDRLHLARYTMDSPDLERELVGLFLAQLPSILESLFTATSRDEWRFATHTLKGSAQAIGACQISDLAEKLEPVASFEQAERRKQLLAGLALATQEFDDLAGRLYP